MRFSTEEPWQQYGFDRLQFGDRPAAALMSIAVERASKTAADVAAELNLPEELVMADSVKLVQDTYVDDGSTGGSQLDVDRMMGTFNPSLGQFIGTIPSMSAKVGLKLKTMVRSGSMDTAAIQQLDSGVLGYKWDPMLDLMSVKVKFNTSKRRKGLRTKPDLSK